MEKGVLEAMEEGNLAGYPVVDIKVSLTTVHHTVDSSEMAFKIAASMSLRGAIDEADPVLLEPIMNVEVTVPENYMGDIKGDRNSRRPNPGMIPGEGMQTIKAQASGRNANYVIDLRSMTQGRGSFTLAFSL